LRLADWVGEEETDPQSIYAAVHLTGAQQAELVGASRPVVSQALKRFQDRGWLECGREGYRILDREALI